MALRSLLLLGGAVALAHAGSSMPVSSSSSSSSSAALGPTRCPLERPVPVDVDIPPGSRLASPPRCAIDRKPSVGWPGYTRPHGSKTTSDAVGMPATALSPTRVRCHLDSAEWPLLTGGNASLTVDSVNGSGNMACPAAATSSSLHFSSRSGAGGRICARATARSSSPSMTHSTRRVCACKLPCLVESASTPLSRLGVSAYRSRWRDYRVMWMRLLPSRS